MHPIEWLRAVARSGAGPQRELASEAAAALSAMADDPQGLLLACRRLVDRHPGSGALWWTCARLLAAADPAEEAAAVQRDLASDQVGLGLTLDLPDAATVTVLGWSDRVDELAVRRGDLRLLAVVAEPAASRGRRRRYGGGGGLAWDDLFDGDSADEATRSIEAVPAAGLGAAVVESDLVLLEAWAAGTERFVAAGGGLAAAATARLTETPVWLTLDVGHRLPDSLFAALAERVPSYLDDATASGADAVDLALVTHVVEPLAIPCPAAPELLR